MDYQNKKPKTSLIAFALVMAGFFVFVWNHEYLINTAPSQAAEILSAITTPETVQNDPLFDVLVKYIRQQQETIYQLQTANKDLLSQLQGATTTATSTDTTEPVVIPPKKILLVAGHTAQTKGAVFGNTTEYELNYDIVKKLEREMRIRGYDVTITHQGSDYSQQFLDYFETNEQRILDFRENKKQAYDKLYPQGVVTNDTDHNYASPLGVIQLYGVNLWANENNMDAVVHMHFNDYPGRPAGKTGTHTGFSVFTPLKTNNHFVESFNLAKSIEEHMLKYTNRSTVTNESAGVLESELIAVGQNNSVNMPSVLIENGFVYESKFTNLTQREIVLTRQANSIANGIEQYFAQ